MAELIEAESQVVRVTFFEDRAEVTRRAAARVDRGVTAVRISGVATMLDDASVQAGITGAGARVLGAKVGRRQRAAPAASGAEIEAIERDLRAASRRRAAAERALGRAAAEQARLEGLMAAWAKALRAPARAGEAGPGSGEGEGAESAGFEASFRALSGAAAAARGRADGAREALARAREDEGRAHARLGEGRATAPRFEATITVHVEATEAHEVKIEIVYRTPCALFRPEHRAELDADEGPGKASLRLVTQATVWQATGEAWVDVACRFSTARPSRSAAAPRIDDDVLSLRRKSDFERQRIAVEGREQAAAQAGLDRGVRAVDEMPGVDDGGEPLWFEADRRVTIPSDGQPLSVPVGIRTMPALVDLIAYPERSEAAYVRATATLSGDAPLLAGPVRAVRGGALVGLSRTGFVPVGEPFELGFGVDDDLRLVRKVDEKREVTAVIGTQHVGRVVRVFVSNLGGALKRLRVVERVPVSELREVTVEVTDAGGGLVDKKTGRVTFELELGPGATKELTLAYRLEASARVDF